jgi:tetratricopeptide (TPR) repeat protein
MRKIAGLVVAVLLCCSLLWGKPVRATHSTLLPQESYRLDIRVDPTLKSVAGSGVLEITNTTSSPIKRLVFSWRENPDDTAEFTVAGRALPLTRLSSDLLAADLPVPLAPDRHLKVAMRFRRSVSPSEDGNRLVLTDWHPRLWLDGYSHASYDVSIVSPEGVAVGASARQDATTKRYRADQLRVFGIFLGRGFQTSESAAGATTVRVLYQPEMKPRAELLLNIAVDVVNFYRQRIGFYPQPSLTIIPGESEAIGGFPLGTALVMIHGMEPTANAPESHWRWITAHEIGHQYWLEHVLAKDPDYPSVNLRFGWLMIGLGFWTDREYSRTHGLPEAHPKRLQEFASSVRSGLDTAITQPPEHIARLQFDYNSKVIHDKGFAVISALSAILGHDTFDKVYRRTLREYAGRRLGTAEFRQIAEEESGQDLGWFFDPMLHTGTYASYEIGTVTKKQDAAEHIVSAQVRSLGTLKLPVPVEATFEDGVRQRLWMNRFADQQVLEFRAKAPLKTLTIDPDHELPLVFPPPDQAELQLAAEVIGLQWTGDGAKSMKLYRRAVDINAKEVFWLKLSLCLFEGGHLQQALDAFARTAAQEKDRRPPLYAGAIVWQGMLHDVLQNRETALGYYRQALALSGDLHMQFSQFNLEIARPWVEERLVTPFKWPK